MENLPIYMYIYVHIQGSKKKNVYIRTTENIKGHYMFVNFLNLYFRLEARKPDYREN